MAEYTDIKTLQLFAIDQNAQIARAALAVYALFPLSIVSLACAEISLRASFRSLTWLGNTTYSTYLLHFPLQISLAILVAKGLLDKSFYTAPISLALFLTALITLSHLCYKKIEMPLQMLIRTHWSNSGG